MSGAYARARGLSESSAVVGQVSHSRVVLAAMPAWGGSFALLVPAIFMQRQSPPAWMIVVGAALLAAAIWATFFFGRLPPREKRARSVLKSVVGIGAPPRILKWDTIDPTRVALLRAWEDADEDADWEGAIRAGRADPRLYALAAYHHEDELAELALDALDRTSSRRFS